jgi:hypothetical protein
MARALHLTQASRSLLGRDLTSPRLMARCYGPITRYEGPYEGESDV